MCCEAGFDVVQVGGRDDQLFVDEAIMKKFINVFEFRPHPLVRAGLGHLTHEVLVEINKKFLCPLGHISVSRAPIPA